ncbi:hypothetical protein K1T71_014689 [Dendrolimus kikuchii]|uniref:Uncharacterized protein n=1 Tax=Dendrolimus kikuchii TaxID=765133 RepID=A0ACC1CEY2_9NEOP|nr:hypothetical protein K1T71_014689 [Dendrolimus kikuchii]
MTSESSSAVLDLNNVDTEDTEPPSITEDSKDIVPLIMEHGYDIAVKVDAPIKQLSTLETFVTYRVQCVCARWPTPPYVRRRYNHFKVLHKRLSQSHPLIATPPLPPLHSARQQLDRYSPSFVAIRTPALHAFLDRVAKHPILTYSDDFRIFLTTPDEDLDKVFKSESNALNLWGLSSAFYGSGEARPTNGARVKDPEFSSAADYLQSLQQKLTTLCTLNSPAMKRACDLWSCQERASVSRASGACACGAHAAHRATLIAARAPPMHRATLPMLAAYAGAHVDKINSRDAVHATYVSGANTTNEVHNRLEQASEALRSELADWLPKTHADIKNLLLDLATRQVNLQTQILMGWEHALKLSTDATVDEMFKTVSKSAVQNLSPSKCRSPNETERDFDDFEDVSNDSDFRDVFVSDDGNVDNGDYGVGIADSLAVDSVKSDEDVTESSVANITKPEVNVSESDATKLMKSAELDITKENSSISDIVNKHDLTETKVFDTRNSDLNSVVTKEYCKDNMEEITTFSHKVDSDAVKLSDSANIDSKVTSDSDLENQVLTVPNDADVSKSTEFLNDILDDNTDSGTNVRSLDNDFKDPLTEFSEVDLS